MKKNILYSTWIWLFSIAISLESCQSHYQVVSIIGSKQIIDKQFDTHPSASATAIVNIYKHGVDSIMSPVIGYCSINMYNGRPESLLSNMASDMLLTQARKFDPQVSMAFTNEGGLRSPLYKGSITYRNVFELFPFENTLCLMTLKGSDLRSLMREIAARNGEGISGICLVISNDSQLVAARVGGKDIDDSTNYRIATMDYLAEGNDNMPSFRKGTDVVYPKNATIRELMVQYVKKNQAKGLYIKATLDGRITILKPSKQ